VRILFALLLLCGCTKVARRPSPEITYKNGLVLYKGSLFTGVLEERFENIETVRRTHYRAGAPDGEETETYKDGTVVARRHFTNGRKSGVHEGWFLDGKRRFHHEFKEGRNDGEVFEWYDSGALSMYARFKDGVLLGKKMWRETGQIYMNYVFPNGKAAGVPGTKLCYQVRNRE
jgi:antitoxin component YwqK of YwqJK toxin-antitoxin module